MEFNDIALGVDIEDIERFQNKDQTFLERVFYIQNKKGAERPF